MLGTGVEATMAPIDGASVPHAATGNSTLLVPLDATVKSLVLERPDWSVSVSCTEYVPERSGVNMGVLVAGSFRAAELPAGAVARLQA